MRTKDHRRRCGTTNLEVVVAASLLVATIGTLSSIAPRLGRLWRTTRNYQLALDELTNQLEYVTSLPESQQKEVLDSIQVSPELKDALPNAKLAHRLLDDESGKRIALSLDWEREPDAKPLTLVAWIQNRSQKLTLTREPISRPEGETANTPESSDSTEPGRESR